MGFIHFSASLPAKANAKAGRKVGSFKSRRPAKIQAAALKRPPFRNEFPVAKLPKPKALYTSSLEFHILLILRQINTWLAANICLLLIFNTRPCKHSYPSSPFIF
jgi:hypothetical protein